MEDSKSYIEDDLEPQRKCIGTLCTAMPALSPDPTITKAYLQDKKDDLYWSMEQFNLIEEIGIRNQLVKTMW